MIDKKALAELQELFVEHFGITLNDEQAVYAGEKLIEMMKVLCRPIPTAIDTTKSRANNESTV